MLSSVTLNCLTTKIVKKQVFNCQKCNQCLKCHKSLGPLFEGALNVFVFVIVFFFVFVFAL